MEVPVPCRRLPELRQGTRSEVTAHALPIGPMLRRIHAQESAHLDDFLVPDGCLEALPG